MITPKFIDSSDTTVETAINGFLLTHPQCQLIENTYAVVKRDIDPSKVQILCGGGAGHEPAHVGFVDCGWISAAVSGRVFASPPTAYVSAAIDYLHSKQGPNGPGILVVVKNYLGDLLNFGFAVEEAKSRGIRVEMVIAADDACFGVADETCRRGIAGTLVLYKILGAAAQQGSSLSELKSLAGRVSSGLRSIGASLSSCSLPACKPTSIVPEGLVEVGLGIHGEKGLSQVDYKGAEVLVKHLLDILQGQIGENKHNKEDWKGCPVALLVNNLGSTTDIEMGILTHHAVQCLRQAGANVVGVCVGRYMTSLEMHGFSLTVLRFVDGADVSYLFDGKQAPLMPFIAPAPANDRLPGPLSAKESILANSTTDSSKSLACQVAVRVFEKLREAEKTFNDLDAVVGDGDLGTGAHNAATHALPLLSRMPWDTQADRALAMLAKVVAEACGGTSGPLYGAFLLGASDALRKAPNDSAVDAVRAALRGGSAEVQRMGRAKKGERTMVDVLETVNESSAVANAKTLSELAQACEYEAQRGAENTAQMPAKHGRSRYLHGKEVGCADPGASLVAFWIKEAAKAAVAIMKL